jgi:YVTN family beta-propeller protein
MPQKPDRGTSVTPVRRRKLASLFALAVIALLTVAAPATAAPYVYVLGKVPGQQWRQYLNVIDAATNAKGPRIQLGLSYGYLLPHAIAMAPDGARVYVINDYDQTVSVVSTATNTVEDVWPTALVGTNPRALAVSPDNRRLYVVGNHQLFIVIDIASRSRVATVTHNQGGAFGVAPSPDGSRVYVMATGSNRVVVVGTAPYAVITRAQLDGFYTRSDSLSVSPNGHFIYVPQREDLDPNEIPIFPLTPPRVVVLDTATGAVVTTRVEHESWHVGISRDGSTIYVPSYQFSGSMHRLSPSTHASLGTTAVSRGFVTAFLSDSTRAYVAADQNVYAIDTATHNIVATIPFDSSVDGRAFGVATTPPPFVPPPPPANLRATVAGNRVTLTWDAPASAPAGYFVEGGVNPGEVLASIPVAGAPTSFDFDAPTGTFYVRLHAWTASGRSAASNEIRIFVNVPQSPSAPTGLLGLADGANLALSWQNASTGGAPTSIVLDVSGATTLSMPLPPNETFAFTGVPPGTYTFAVRAANAGGSSAPSPPVTLSFPGTCPGAPQQPLNLEVSRTGSVVSARWDPPGSGAAVSSYLLTVTGSLDVTLPMTARSISGTVPSGTYNLSVMAVNPCGSGVATPPQSVVVP